MHAIPTLIVHNGALGDFLCSWPAVRSILAAFPYAFWAGSDAYSRWVQPLGGARVSPDLRAGLDQLYGATKLPRALRGCRVFWFGLDSAPWDFAHPDLVFLHSTRPNSHARPRHLHRETLRSHGIEFLRDWRGAWKKLFGAWKQGIGNSVLLFPGAGHRRKQWPLVQFFELAHLLALHGAKPCFVLGPAEMERGMVIRDFDVVRPQDYQELTEMLLSAQGLVGNDCGPLHLAGMHGAPGVILFGPTSPEQWCPPGLLPMVSSPPCAPCTRTTANLRCSEPRCLMSLKPEEVFRILSPLLQS